MCLVKRNKTCDACYWISVAEMMMETLDDNIDSISDGKYLKAMNNAKEIYDGSQAEHKRGGCIDHMEPVDVEGEVEVEEFEWQGVLYYKTIQPNEDGRYVLYSSDDHEIRGTITQGLVEIW